MGQKITGYSEARHAKALLDEAIGLLDMAGLAVVAAKAADAREHLDDWLAVALADFVRSPEFLDAGRHAN